MCWGRTEASVGGPPQADETRNTKSTRKALFIGAFYAGRARTVHAADPATRSGQGDARCAQVDGNALEQTRPEHLVELEVVEVYVADVATAGVVAARARQQQAALWQEDGTRQVPAHLYIR